MIKIAKISFFILFFSSNTVIGNINSVSAKVIEDELHYGSSYEVKDEKGRIRIITTGFQRQKKIGAEYLCTLVHYRTERLYGKREREIAYFVTFTNAFALDKFRMTNIGMNGEFAVNKRDVWVLEIKGVFLNNYAYMDSPDFLNKYVLKEEGLQRFKKPKKTVIGIVGSRERVRTLSRALAEKIRRCKDGSRHNLPSYR